MRACTSLHFLSLIPCGLVVGHEKPHRGLVTGRQKRARVAWDDEHGSIWRIGQIMDVDA